MMGYFSNGTEGDMYEEKYCEKCVHYGEAGEGCTVLILHTIWNYDQINPNDDHATAKKWALDTLIPRTKDGLGNKECTMFHSKQEPPGPTHLPGCRYYGDDREPDASCANSGGACSAT